MPKTETLTAPARTYRVRRNEIAATTTIEIEIGVTGIYQPGCPERGPTYACGGTPAEPAGFEDVELDTLAALTHVWSVRKGAFDWQKTNLLKGVDCTCPEVRKLLDNLLNAVAEAAEQALLDEVAE